MDAFNKKFTAIIDEALVRPPADVTDQKQFRIGLEYAADLAIQVGTLAGKYNATAAQFVAEFFSTVHTQSDKPFPDYTAFGNETTWEDFVKLVYDAGLILAELVVDKRFDQWYDILSDCSTQYGKQLGDTRGNVSEEILRAEFKRIIDKYENPETYLDPVEALRELMRVADYDDDADGSDRGEYDRAMERAKHAIEMADAKKGAPNV